MAEGRSARILLLKLRELRSDSGNVATTCRRWKEVTFVLRWMERGWWGGGREVRKDVEMLE